MILVHEPEAEQLTVALFHRSAFGPADEIGRCQVQMLRLHTPGAEAVHAHLHRVS